MNNIDLVKALHQLWNTGDLALIDRVCPPSLNS
jgi:hypothetical protein